MQTCTDPLFCLPGPSQLVHHLAHPSAHLHTPLCTSAHLCAPLRTLLHTSVHLRTLPRISAHLRAPLHNFCTSLSRASHPYRTFHFDLGYLGQLSPSATGHNAHPWTSVESSPNSAAPIQPIHFPLWACTTHIAIQGPCLAGSPLPKWHSFSLR